MEAGTQAGSVARMAGGVLLLVLGVGAWSMPVRAAPPPLVAVPARAAPEEEGPPASPVGGPALAEALALRKAAYDLEGEARDAALLEAARSLEAVADERSHDAVVRAEAAFRAGEILRAQKRGEEAAEAFSQATALGEVLARGPGREFAARGLLEQAHLRRREGRTEEALELYRAVRSRFPAERRQVAHATTWGGKVLLKDGRLEEASALLLDLEVFVPEYPLEAIRNVEALALAWAEEGAPERAGDAVEALEIALRPVQESGGKMAEQVASALGDLRVTVPPSGY